MPCGLVDMIIPLYLYLYLIVIQIITLKEEVNKIKLSPCTVVPVITLISGTTVQ